MSKNTYYFSHDLNAHQDEKIMDLRMDHGMEGYGIYWLIVEQLAGTDGYVMELNPKRIAFANSVNPDIVYDVITKYGLFDIDEGTFTSKSLVKRMSKLDSIRKTRQENGRKGGMAKAKASKTVATLEQSPSKTLATLEQTSSKPLANPTIGKERKEKEMKGDDRKGTKIIEDDLIEDEINNSSNKGASAKENLDSGALDSNSIGSSSSQQAATVSQQSWHGFEDTNGYALRNEPKEGTLIRNPHTGEITEYEK